MTTTPDDASIPADFSICRGGPVYEIGRRLGLRPGAQGLRRLGLILGLLAWVPLAGLALLDGVLHQGATIPFWPSVGTHVRFLLAIPLFFLAEALFDTRVADVLRRMLEIGLILPGDRPRLAAAVRQAIKARNSWLLEAALAVLTGAFIWAGLRTDLPLDVSTWRATAAGDPTLGWLVVSPGEPAALSVPVLALVLPPRHLVAPAVAHLPAGPAVDSHAS